MGSEANSGCGDEAPAMNKTVQRLKEIVKDCTETEIYIALRECDMDPNEAVQKLLSQGTFHEVKSKRDRRKEMKETQDLRWQGGKDNVAQCGSIRISSGVKRENESVDAPLYSVSISTSHGKGKTLIQQPPPYGAAFDSDHRSQSTGTGDATTFSQEPPQPAWLGASAENNVSEMVNDASMNADQYGFDDEWPVIEQPIAASGSSFVNASATSDVVDSKPSSLYEDRVKLSWRHLPDEIQISEGGRDSNSDYIGCASVSSRQMTLNSAEGTSHRDNDLYKDTCSYGSSRGKDEHWKEVSSVSTELQTLSLGKEDRVRPQTDNKCDLVFANNLQTLTADCSHLMFGTYRSNNGSAFPPASNLRKSDLDESLSATNGSLARHLNTRNLAYHGEERQIGSMYDTQRATTDARNYDTTLSQPNGMNCDIAEGTLRHEYFKSPIPASSYTNSQQSSSVLSSAKLDPHIRNLPLTNKANAYSNPTPDLLASAVQSMRDSDIFQSELLAKQSMHSGYNGVISSTSSPSLTKILKSDPFSLSKPSVQTLSGSSFVTGLPFPNHHTAQSYAEPAPSLDQLADMRGYPVVTQSQSYSFLPSDFPEAYTVTNPSLQSPAGLKYSLPRYKSGAFVNQSEYDLDQKYAMPNPSYSGYERFGSSSNIPESFLHSPSIASRSATNGYNELLRAQYKELNRLAALRQKNINAARDYDLGSRTTAAVPGSAYYNLLMQSRQPSNHHGEYRDLYQPQTGVNKEYGINTLGFDFERF